MKPRWIIACLVGFTFAAFATNEAFAGDTFVQAGGHASLLSDSPDRQLLVPGLGYQARVGMRWGDWGAFFEAGQASWVATTSRFDFEPGVLNLGMGGEFLFADERLRSSFVFGSSTLLFDAAFDEAGSTGIFVALRPVAIRWDLGAQHVLQLTPFSAVFMQPTTETPLLQRIEYQTVLTWEFEL